MKERWQPTAHLRWYGSELQQSWTRDCGEYRDVGGLQKMWSTWTEQEWRRIPREPMAEAAQETCPDPTKWNGPTHICVDNKVHIGARGSCDRCTAPRTESCRIHEHDGAFKCYAHNRTWGAVSKPDEPCAGWSASEKRDDRPRCEHGYLKGEGFEAFTICPTCNVLNR